MMARSPASSRGASRLTLSARPSFITTSMAFSAMAQPTGWPEAVKDADTREPFPGHLSVSERIANTCTDLGLICRPLGQSIVLCPPFILTDAQMDEMFDKLDAALARVFDGLRAEGQA